MSTCRNAKDLTFVIVDDFSTMRRIVAGLVRELGYSRITEAEHGEQMLARVRALEGNCIVLSDWNMPVMDGLSALQALRADADPVLAHVPVLMITAEACKENVIAAARAGADGYIVKPFTEEVLREKLLKIFQKRGIEP